MKTIKKILLVGIVMVVSMLSGYGNRYSIYVYNGPGVFGHCVTITMAAIRANINREMYSVRELKPDDLMRGDWREDGALLVMPGIEVGPCVECIGEVGMNQIRDYVGEGGRYLGICGGGYFGCREIFFTQPDGFVKTRRGLGLFEGVARGPVLAVFSTSEQVPQLALVHGRSSRRGEWDSRIYWNGGSAFVNEGVSGVVAASLSIAQFLAEYVYDDGGRQQPWDRLLDTQRVQPEVLTGAVVSCRYGEGRVVLSGIHPETNGECLRRMSESFAYLPGPRWQTYRDLYEQMGHELSGDNQRCDDLREAFLRQILEELGIELNEETEPYKEGE